MKNKKLKNILMLCLVLSLLIGQLFETNRYVRHNIKAIDKADTVHLIKDEVVSSYPMDEEIARLVAYGGYEVKDEGFFEGVRSMYGEKFDRYNDYIVKVDNSIDGNFSPYKNELVKTGIKIRYLKDGSTLKTAHVYQSQDDPQGYLIHLGRVYWTTNSKLADLLDLID